MPRLSTSRQCFVNVFNIFQCFSMLSMFCQDCRPAAANFGENGGVVQLLHRGSHESPSENGRRLIFFKLILTVTIKAIFHWLFFINHISNSIQMFPNEISNCYEMGNLHLAPPTNNGSIRQQTHLFSKYISF